MDAMRKGWQDGARLLPLLQSLDDIAGNVPKFRLELLVARSLTRDGRTTAAGVGIDRP